MLFCSKGAIANRWAVRRTQDSLRPQQTQVHRPHTNKLRASTGFEPHVDPSVAAAQLAVLATTVGTAAYWWLVLVPSERVSLAKNKRKGELKQYLDELEADGSRSLERWFYTDWLQAREKRRQQAQQVAELRQRAAAAAADASTELATDAAERSRSAVATIERTAEAEDDVAEPEVVPAAEDPSQMPSFWSLDNPIVVTFAVLGMAAALSVLLSNVQQLAGW